VNDSAHSTPMEDIPKFQRGGLALEKSGIVPEAKRLLEQLSIASCRQEMPA
jgi:hypothetical protein